MPGEDTGQVDRRKKKEHVARKLAKNKKVNLFVKNRKY